MNIEEKINYCLNCKNPQCKKMCPLENDIPGFIHALKDDNYEKAYDILTKTTILSSICGRICPHLKQCQKGCIRGIKGEPVSIGELESKVGDWALENKDSLLESFKRQGMTDKNIDKKIAVIGGGPSGLTCAAFLRKQGYSVTIYEKYNSLGGILKRGIPDFRLQNEIVDKVILQILNLGIDVKYGKELGKNLSIKELEKEYDAIYLSVGANIPRKMAIEGEELNGVYGGNTLLENGEHPNYEGKKVAIIGGGNVAMDCARTIKKKGADVIVIYRRSEEEMPAEKKEIQDAKNEGIKFLFLNNIVKIIGKNKVEKIECIKTKLVKKEGETRLSPINIENSNYILNMDYVVMAVGGKIDKEMLELEGFETTKNKYLKVNENYMTSKDKVYAGGDVIGETSTVAWAASNGRKVAYEIDKCLNK